MLKNWVKLSCLLAILPATTSLTCTVCEFALLPPHSTNCNETCEGDVCFIVVNKYFNGTINAGCMRLHDGDSFKDKAICQRGEYDNRCACSTTDHCNDPKVKINSYVFTQNPVLEGYQWLPQIQPPMPPLQPVLPPVELPVPLENDHDMNETVAELESGVETDLLNDLDNETWIPRKDEKHEENLLTVTTTVGLNVRDHTSRVNNSIGQHLESTTGKSFTAGQGSVEVTKVTQEATPMQSPPKNRTSDGTDPNSTGTSQFFFALALPVLLRRILL